MNLNKIKELVDIKMENNAQAISRGENPEAVVSPTMYKGAVLLDNDILDTTRLFYPNKDIAPSLDNVLDNFGEMYEAIASRYGAKIADRMLTRAVSRTVGYPIDKINAKKLVMGAGRATKMMGLDRDLLAVLPTRYVHKYNETLSNTLKGLEETRLYGRTAYVSKNKVEKVNLEKVSTLDYTPTKEGFLVPTVLLNGKVKGKETAGTIDYPLVRVPEDVFFGLLDEMDSQVNKMHINPFDKDVLLTQVARFQDAIDKVSTGVISEGYYAYWAESYLSGLATLTETDISKPSKQDQLTIDGMDNNQSTLNQIYSVYFPGKVLIKQGPEGTHVTGRNGETLSPEYGYTPDGGQN